MSVKRVHASPRIVIAVLFAALTIWFVAISSKSVRSASGAWRYGRRSGWCLPLPARAGPLITLLLVR
ncbi:hypothetical protein O1L60_40580 [Streptomyces diastatochromogenes]|nr:hypothetical protein [Streptomyces diastatochromogenes]